MHSVINTAVHLCGLITFIALYLLTEKTNDAKDHPVPVETRGTLPCWTLDFWLFVQRYINTKKGS